MTMPTASPASSQSKSRVLRLSKIADIRNYSDESRVMRVSETSFYSSLLQGDLLRSGRLFVAGLAIVFVVDGAHGRGCVCAAEADVFDQGEDGKLRLVSGR